MGSRERDGQAALDPTKAATVERESDSHKLIQHFNEPSPRPGSQKFTALFVSPSTATFVLLPSPFFALYHHQIS